MDLNYEIKTNWNNHWCCCLSLTANKSKSEEYSFSWINWNIFLLCFSSFHCSSLTMYTFSNRKCLKGMNATKYLFGCDWFVISNVNIWQSNSNSASFIAVFRAFQSNKLNLHQIFQEYWNRKYLINIWLNFDVFRSKCFLFFQMKTKCVPLKNNYNIFSSIKYENKWIEIDGIDRKHYA